MSGREAEALVAVAEAMRRAAVGLLGGEPGSRVASGLLGWAGRLDRAAGRPAEEVLGETVAAAEGRAAA